MGRSFFTAAWVSVMLLPRAQASHARSVYTPDEVRRVLAKRLTPEELLRLKVPFEANRAIRKLAARITRGANTDRQKLSSLLHYFRKKGYLDRYEQSGTLTATEALEEDKGNCLAYANLFIAMARSVGLRAVYLDASRVLHEFGRAGSVLVDYGHIMAGVKNGPDITAVDFDGRTRQSRRYLVLSDLDAIAEYYSNLGYELAWLRRKEGGFGSTDAIRAFHLATRIAPDFARGWNNLGVALGRSSRIAESAAAYRRAIQADASLPAPHANLGQVYLRKGEIRKAISSFEQAVRLRPDNEHYRYFLGKSLAQAGQHLRALEQFQAGVGINDEMFLLHMQLASVYLELKDHRRAGSAAQRVLELVPGHRDATRLLKCLGDRSCHGV